MRAFLFVAMALLLVGCAQPNGPRALERPSLGVLPAGKRTLTAFERDLLLDQIVARRRSSPWLRVTSVLSATGSPTVGCVAVMGHGRVRQDIYREDGSLIATVVAWREGDGIRQQEYSSESGAFAEAECPDFGHVWPEHIDGKLICNFGNLSYPWMDAKEDNGWDELLARSTVTIARVNGRRCYRFFSEDGDDTFHVTREYYFDASTKEYAFCRMGQTNKGVHSTREYVVTVEHLEQDPGTGWTLRPRAGGALPQARAGQP